MLINHAEVDDLQEILALQYLAYQSEARLVNDYKIQPLTQTIEEIRREYENGCILKATIDEKIIGSVRSFAENGTCYIGKLFVHPDYQGNGIGSRLLSEAEKACPQERYELFTSDKSLRNIKLYERMGYKKYKEVEITPALKMIYMEKFAQLAV
jgi:ribosomal protein S18 acetylase RimI-like enzyme